MTFLSWRWSSTSLTLKFSPPPHLVPVHGMMVGSIQSTSNERCTGSSAMNSSMRCFTADGSWFNS